MIIANKELKEEIDLVIETSEKMVIIISPYIDIDEDTKSAFKKLAPEVSKVIVYRENSNPTNRAGISDDSRFFFKSLPYIELITVKDLHAKIFFNEFEAIISTMNLTKSSNNNFEVGWSIDAEEEQEEFFELAHYIESILKSDKCNLSEDRVKNIMPGNLFGLSISGTDIIINGQQIPENTFKHFHDSCNVKHGVCIRCGITSMKFYPRQPLCLNCFKEWRKFKNRFHNEKVCHRCGVEVKTTINDPLCGACMHVYKFEMEREWKKQTKLLQKII